MLWQAQSMAKIQETKVSLRFSGDDLNPQELTERLGAMPSSATVKGETLASSTGRVRVGKTGTWLLRVEPAAPDEDFREQVTRLFAQLTSDEDIWHELSRRFAGNLFVGLFLGCSNEGFVIEAELLNAITARGLELGFDVYSPSAE
jgi:hypothetical protein